MISRLEIDNFILISHQEINFNQEINVLTGDTGSGKSIIIKAIKFIIGARSNSNLYLNKTKQIKVTAIFTADKRLKDRLARLQIATDEQIEVVRILSPEGKNTIRVNGELITVTVLQKLFEEVITIYSQGSVSKFQSTSNYLQIVDNMLKEDDFLEFKNAYREYAKISKELEQMKQLALTQTERNQLLKIKYDDLIQINEQFDIDKLIEEKRSLEANLQKQQLSNLGTEYFVAVNSSINQILKLDLTEDQVELISEAKVNLDEVNYQLEQAATVVDKQYLAEITDYISMCRKLARKYNIEISKLSAHKQYVQEQLSSIESLSADIINLENRLQKHYQIAYSLAKVLSNKRKNASLNIVKEVNANLSKLSLNGSDFRITINHDKLTSSGMDQCIFEVKINQGGEYTVLHQTASGGEIARFLLALESACARPRSSGFIIFDEIDSGVSGHVATEMANVMKQISTSHRLLIITHLAQVAAISQNHYVISKQTIGDRAISSAKLLSNNQKPGEIAKMISGIRTSTEAIAHAKTLLNQY